MILQCQIFGAKQLMTQDSPQIYYLKNGISASFKQKMLSFSFQELVELGTKRNTFANTLLKIEISISVS